MTVFIIISAVTLFFLSLLLLMLLIPFYIQIEINYQKTFDVRITIEWFFKLIRIQLRPKIEWDQLFERPPTLVTREVPKISKKYINSFCIKEIKKVLPKVHIHTMQWMTTIGMPSPFLTALSVGSVTFVKSTLFSILSSYLTFFTPPKFLVTPHFVRNTFETSIKTNLQIRIIYFLTAGIKCWWRWQPK